MNAPMIEATGINAWYGSSHVLRDVDFTVGVGETVGLLGRNGMGKSTLLRTLLGHVRQRQGQIRVAAATSRARSRSRWRAWAWPTCRRAAASSPACRCAKTC